MTTLADLLDSESHPKKLRQLAICRELFEGFDFMQPPEGARHMGNVQDVIDGVGIPTMSAEERARIEAAAARIPEEP